ncbi:MAG: FGGY-family carbohydrate kinase [Lachnospiraceae bacterium]|nr:FGGY-family carbohydrate kinase [Ruminococcus sp.]MCM1274036.1 FGGY-family carbohydrate kinase [Lachnospiraceae bacterium]
MTIQEKIERGQVFLGIELGSTRIKASLVDETYAPVAGGSHAWENRLENGYWTYSLGDIHGGLRACYADLKRDVRERYGVTLANIGAIGVSAMMHGYMPFDGDDNLLVPFRTWRNTTTERAAKELTELFGFNIPQRWSVAHLYQAVLDNEPHIGKLAHMTTLAGYIHFLLTGERAVGVGEASGMFPISGGGYDAAMLEKFDNALREKGMIFKTSEVFPRVMTAGERCGALTEEGAKFLDPDGDLKHGAPFCPPEGDAGTGMVATNAVLPKTGNISAGTSIFSMLVLEKQLGGVYPEIDVVTTPDGAPVAMVHCNNCCSELDAWVGVFGEFAELFGIAADKSELYERLYKKALGGDSDCGGVVAYNCLSGEPVIGVEDGRPMYFRAPDSKMTLANFMRAEMYSAFAALSCGMDKLFKNERVAAETFTGHGGLFKVEGAAQQLLSDALNTPVSVMKTAGEGGAWGMALLAAYSVNGKGKSLAEWLDSAVFADMGKHTVLPNEKGTRGFAEYMKRYLGGLDAERSLKNA